MVLTKCGKISDVQAVGSAVTAILKEAVPAVRKSCDSYHEKAVPTVRKSYLLWAVGAFKLLGRSFQHLLYERSEERRVGKEQHKRKVF